MNHEDFIFLLEIRTMPEANLNGLYEELLENSWSLKALGKHAGLRNYKLDKRAIIFIFYAAESAIGLMVKMLQSIDAWNKEANQSIITFDHLALYVFPDLKIPMK